MDGLEIHREAHDLPPEIKVDIIHKVVEGSPGQNVAQKLLKWMEERKNSNRWDLNQRVQNRTQKKRGNQVSSGFVGI